MSNRRAALPFGLSIRSAVIGVAVLAVFFSGTLWALNKFLPTDTLNESRPVTVAIGPLPPATRTSVVVAPVAVAALAIRAVSYTHLTLPTNREV